LVALARARAALAYLSCVPAKSVSEVLFWCTPAATILTKATGWLTLGVLLASVTQPQRLSQTVHSRLVSHVALFTGAGAVFALGILGRAILICGAGTSDTRKAGAVMVEVAHATLACSLRATARVVQHAVIVRFARRTDTGSVRSTLLSVRRHVVARKAAADFFLDGVLARFRWQTAGAL